MKLRQGVNKSNRRPVVWAKQWCVVNLCLVEWLITWSLLPELHSLPGCFFFETLSARGWHPPTVPEKLKLILSEIRSLNYPLTLTPVCQAHKCLVLCYDGVQTAFVFSLQHSSNTLFLIWPSTKFCAELGRLRWHCACFVSLCRRKQGRLNM